MLVGKMNKPNWIRDLARGDVGEREFLETFPLYRKGEDINRYEHDFVHSITGETAELKTDYYKMSKTPNIIVERYSNYEKGTPGGPYRHNGDLSTWVYYYMKDGIMFMYDPLQLIEIVESLGLPLIPVRNPGYTTMVYKVPREAVQDAVLQVVNIAGKYR